MTSAPEPGRTTAAGRPDPWRPAERLFLLGALIAQQDAFFNVARVLQGQDAALAGDIQSDPLNMLAVAATFVGLIVLFARRPEILGRVLAGSALALVLCAFAGVSSLWSDSPGLSLKRTLVLTNGMLLAFYVASRFAFRDAVGLLAQSIAVCAVASLLAAVAAPRIGIMQTPGLEGRWRGVFSHKNTLAQSMALGAVLQFYALHQGDRRARVLAILGLEVALILLANSATARLVVVFAAGLYLAYFVGRGRGPAARLFWVAAPIAAGALAVLALTVPTLGEALTGRDASLTGRAPLWAGVESAIAQRPLLGYGYQAFWDSIDPLAARIRTEIGWDAPNSHNGVLEVLLGLGAVGGALTGALVLQAGLRSARLLFRGGALAPAGLLSSVLVLGILLESQAEAVLMHQGDIDWLTLNLVSLAAFRLLPPRASTPRDLSRQVLARARPAPPGAGGLPAGGPRH